MEHKQPTGSSLAEHARAAEEKHVRASFSLLNTLAARESYSITSASLCINGVSLRLWKGERQFEFETDRIQTSAECIEEKNMFGFGSPVSLSSSTISVRLDWTKRISHNFIDWIIRGEAPHVSSNILIGERMFHRMMIPIGQDHEQDPRSYIESRGLRIGETYRAAGIIDIILPFQHLHIFVEKEHKQNYLFIDGQKEIELGEFKNLCSTILWALGFLTGYLPRDEHFVLQSRDVNHLSPIGVQFERQQDTIYSRVQVIDNAWNIEVGGRRQIWRAPSSTLTQLVLRCSQDASLARTLRLVCECNSLPLELKAGVYCVALETMKSIILEKATDEIKPVKDKKALNQMQSRFRDVISEMSDDLFGDKQALLRKIDNINTPANRKGLSRCFELVGVGLRESEEKCLLLRDEFLHGRLPFSETDGVADPPQLRFMVNKLHFLVAVLVMKWSGYSRPVVNNAAFLHWRDLDENSGEEPYRMV